MAGHTSTARKSGSSESVGGFLQSLSRIGEKVGGQKRFLQQRETQQLQRELENIFREQQFTEQKRARGVQETQAGESLTERKRAALASEGIQAENLKLRKQLGLQEFKLRLREAGIDPNDPNALLIRNAVAKDLGLEERDIPTTGIRPDVPVEEKKGGFLGGILSGLAPKAAVPTAASFATDDLGLRPLPGLAPPVQVGTTKEFLPFPEMAVSAPANSFEIDFRQTAEKGLTKNRVKSLKERYEATIRSQLIPDDRIKGDRAIANAEAQVRNLALPFPDLGGGPAPVEDQADDLGERLPFRFRSPAQQGGTTSDFIPGKTVIGGVDITKPDIPALSNVSPTLANRVDQASLLTPFQLDAAVLQVELLANKGKITPHESAELLSYFGSIRFENHIGISGATSGVPLESP